MTDAPRRQVQGPPIQFRDRRVEAQLADRTGADLSPGLVAARDLARYYAALGRELAAVELSEAEALLVCDALNGTWLDEGSVHLLWAEVDEAVQGDNLHIKWQIGDELALVRRLRGLTYTQSLAVWDAVERFWRTPDRDARETIRAVGLVR